MCGRFSLFTDASEMGRYFEVEDFRRGWEPRYNISPTQDILAVFDDGGKRVADGFRWGLIPHWSREDGDGFINARAETLDKKPSFRDCFIGKRCIIAADGFYEWMRTPSGGKRPYYIRPEGGGVFGFAGIYDEWTSHGKKLRTAAIITTDADSIVAPIHERMPSILKRRDYGIWLDPLNHDLSGLKGMIMAPDIGLEAYPVSKDVNTAENEGPRLIKPLPDDPPDQRTLDDFF